MIFKKLPEIENSCGHEIAVRCPITRQIIGEGFVKSECTILIRYVPSKTLKAADRYNLKSPVNKAHMSRKAFSI